MVMVASRRRAPSVVLAGAVLVLATAVWWQATPAHAADVTVRVEMTDEGPRYVPGEVAIELGDTVTWVWETDGHSVTHQPAGEDEEPLFDSHPGAPVCLPCGRTGDEFVFSDFPEPGTYVYGSKMNPEMRGRVKVEPTSEPSTSEPSTSEPSSSESSTSEPSTSEPSTSETSQPESSPDPASSSESEPEPAPEPEPEPAPEPAPPPPPEPAPEQQRAAPQSVERDTAAEAPSAGSPTVAAEDSSPSPVPTPSFEDFPRASDPTDDTDVSGEVALGGTDDGGGSARTVWALVGGASVLGTLGALGRTVLFADAGKA